MPILFILFVVVPICEIILLVEVGQSFGWGAAILSVLATAVLGSFLLRRQGLQTLFRAQQKINSGQIPAHEMGEGIMLAISGAFLLTPGYLTDGVGFLLLIPAFRRIVMSQFKASSTLNSHHETYNFTSTHHHGDLREDVIEGEFSSVKEQKNNEN